MSFDVAAQSYDLFMGRWSGPLAARFADLAGLDDLGPDDRVLDVGCGPGALTGVLVDRVGAAAVSAVDPSQSFVAAVRGRWPEVDVRQASAAELPFPDGAFAATLAQLVVHFMPDPVAGLAELARVTRPGGTVAACVWDHGTGRGPVSTFWRAVHDVDPDATDESDLPGVGPGQLADLFAAAGLVDVEAGEIAVHREFGPDDDLWAPFTLGVGPAGAYVARLDADTVRALRTRYLELVPPPPCTLTAVTWTATGRVA